MKFRLLDGQRDSCAERALPGRSCARRERRPRPVPRPTDLRRVVPTLAGAPIPGRPRPQRSRGEPCRLALDDRERAARPRSPLGFLGDPDGRTAPESAFCILITSGLVRVTSCENSQDDQSASGAACRDRWRARSTPASELGHGAPARVTPAACAGWGCSLRSRPVVAEGGRLR